MLACVGKLIAFRQNRARNARRKTTAQQPVTVVKPFFWIIATSLREVLDEPS